MPGRRRPPHPSSPRSSAADRRPPRNHHGFHVLRDPAVVRALVRSAGLGPDDLVVELGAGSGVLTLALARTGARVIAVERDPRLARRLARRTADDATVRVVEGDLRSVPLPHRPFHVVANIPFATGTDLLRRLLDEHHRGTALAGADLLVEWGFARRLVAAPVDRTTAGWQRRFRFDLVRRVPARSFSPAPRVDAAHLAIRRR
ncbi:MAG TPA: rRNA adenine N(6)-methyltransferase family protein [Iamia sp.]|nr:rRNA adenine N(6)-methyltransferase family protein [Iamia sp.]